MGTGRAVDAGKGTPWTAVRVWVGLGTLGGDTVAAGWVGLGTTGGAEDSRRRTRDIRTALGGTRDGRGG